MEFYPQKQQVGYPGDDEYAEEEMGGDYQHDEIGIWSEHKRLPNLLRRGESLSSVTFDPIREILWSGTSTGHLSGNIVGDDEISRQLELQEMGGAIRYSSFKVADSPVLEILPYHENIFSVGSKAVEFHTSGGMHIARFAYAQEILEDLQLGDTIPDMTFTCASLARPFDTLVTDEASWATNMLVGSSIQKAFCFDLATGLSPILTYDVNVPTTCCEISEGGNFVAMGGNDGKIRLLDSRFRSNRV